MVREQITKSRLSFDKMISKRDGTIVLRKGFFYRFGYDSNKFADDVTIAAQGLGVKVIEHFENWQRWPRDSYWEVVLE
jgi:hypothetical protein